MPLRQSKQSTFPPHWQAVTAIAALGLFVACGYFLFTYTELDDLLGREDELLALIKDVGPYGPLLIILFIAVAVVFSPLPSAPVALVAGALYGHVYGTIYVILGAEVGAIAAFFIARKTARGVIEKLIGHYLSLPNHRSQSVLMGLVFISRLMPFVSFDVVSYAAGLSPLKFWRFALATLAGIAPMSFLLAHFGHEFASLEGDRINNALLLIALIAALSFVINYFRSRRQRGNTPTK